MEYVEVTGLDEAIRAMDRAPETLGRIARKAMGAGARSAATELRRTSPARWRRLVKGKVSRTHEGKLNAGVGYFFNGQTGGHQNRGGKPVFDWFKAYWANYGTLENRDPGHTFQKPVRPAKSAIGRRRRNRRGQKPQHFFERGLPGVPPAFEKGFIKSLEKQNDKLIKP